MVATYRYQRPGHRLDAPFGSVHPAISMNDTPTQFQLKSLETTWQTGSLKQAAHVIGLSKKTVEYHLQELRMKLGHPSWSLLDLFRHAVRKGWILAVLPLLCSPAFAKRKPPPVPPPVVSSAEAWWTSVPGVSGYAIVCAGRTNITFGTNETLTGLTNGVNYSVYVESISNGVPSKPSCAVFFTAGSKLTNSCPVTINPSVP